MVPSHTLKSMQSTAIGITTTWFEAGVNFLRGFWNGAREEEIEVEVQEESPPPERRAEGRIDHAARVMSKELPHFQALTLDLSDRGLRLATSGPVEPGTAMTLTLQLHENDVFPIRFQGECVWSEPSERGPHQIGVDVSPSNERVLTVLERYVEQQRAVVDAAARHPKPLPAEQQPSLVKE